MSLSFVTFVVAMIAVLNPIGNAALYVGMIGDRSKHEQHKTAFVCAIAVAVILLLSVWVGLPLLHIFGISISAFQIAGGLIVTLIGLSMIRGNAHTNEAHKDEEQEKLKQKDAIAVVPLAIPIIAGPGAISTIIAHATEFDNFAMRGLESIAMIVLAAGIGVVLFLAPFLARFLGEYGMKIVTRVMGLILTAIAFQMIGAGMLGMFPGLAH